MPPKTKTLADLENEVDPNPLEVPLLMPQEERMLQALNNLFEEIEEEHDLEPDVFREQDAPGDDYDQ